MIGIQTKRRLLANKNSLPETKQAHLAFNTAFLHRWWTIFV